MSPKVTSDEPFPDRTKDRAASQDVVRARAERVIRVVFGLCATILALGALLVVLRNNINEDNALVKLITNVADNISGPFSRENGIFDFDGKNAEAKNALLNWGIAALAYLVIGRLIANVIAPKSGK